jgi:hypothetical protein
VASVPSGLSLTPLRMKKIKNKYQLRYLSRYSDGQRVGQPGFDSRQEQHIFLYSTASSPAMGTSYPMDIGGKAAGEWS